MYGIVFTTRITSDLFSRRWKDDTSSVRSPGSLTPDEVRVEIISDIGLPTQSAVASSSLTNQQCRLQLRVQLWLLIEFLQSSPDSLVRPLGQIVLKCVCERTPECTTWHQFIPRTSAESDRSVTFFTKNAAFRAARPCSAIISSSCL